MQCTHGCGVDPRPLPKLMVAQMQSTTFDPEHFRETLNVTHPLSPFEGCSPASPLPPTHPTDPPAGPGPKTHRMQPATGTKDAENQEDGTMSRTTEIRAGLGLQAVSGEYRHAGCMEHAAQQNGPGARVMPCQRPSRAHSHNQMGARGYRNNGQGFVGLGMAGGGGRDHASTRRRAWLLADLPRP